MLGGDVLAADRGAVRALRATRTDTQFAPAVEASVSALVSGWCQDPAGDRPARKQYRELICKMVDL